MIGLNHYLIIAATLFSLGIATVLTKRHALGVLIGVELMLNAANINLVAFNFYTREHIGALLQTSAVAERQTTDGLLFAIFVVVIAAAEAAVALAIFLNFYNNTASIDVDRASRLRG